MSRCFFGAIIVFFLSWSVPASAAIIDFEGFVDSEVLGTQIPGLTFTDAIVLSAGISLNEFEFPPSSGSNAAVDLDGSVRMDFAAPVSGFSGFFTYFFPFTITAFDASGFPLATVTTAFNSNAGLSGDVGSNPNEFLEVVATGISFLTITGAAPGGFSFAFDDINVVTPAAVSEPGALVLTLLGLVTIVRKRRVS